MPAIIVLVRNRPADMGLHPDGAATASVSTAHGAPAPAENLLRSGRFWRIAITVGTVFAVNAALLVNLVPLRYEARYSDPIAPPRRMSI